MVRTDCTESRFNLPGGGRNRGESPYEALHRELREELPESFPLNDIGFEVIGSTEGMVVNRGGSLLLAKWLLYGGKLVGDAVYKAIEDSKGKAALVAASDLLAMWRQRPDAVSELALRSILDYGLPRLGR